MGSGRGWLAGDWPSTGEFSTLLRPPGLLASSDGVLTTKIERKMLASTYACTRSMPGLELCNSRDMREFLTVMRHSSADLMNAMVLPAIDAVPVALYLYLLENRHGCPVHC